MGCKEFAVQFPYHVKAGLQSGHLVLKCGIQTESHICFSRLHCTVQSNGEACAGVLPSQDLEVPTFGVGDPDLKAFVAYDVLSILA